MLNKRVLRSAGHFFAILFLFCLGCAGKAPATPEPLSQANGEYLVFLSAVQGNPVCLFVSVQKTRVSGFLSSPRTKWQAHVWMVLPGLSKTLFTETGRDKEDPTVPLNWTDDALLFTTEKDRFVFYKPFQLDKLLFLSDSIFPDRVRRAQEEEIRYGLVPSSLYWNNRKMEGMLFYETKTLSPLTRHGTFLPLTGLPPGGRVYALWAPDGPFLYLEQSAGEESSPRGSLAIMQDRRGRWDETFEAEVLEPACAFSDSPCSGEQGTLRVRIPQWRLEGSMAVLRDVRPGLEAHVREEVQTPEAAPGQNVLWASFKDLPEDRKTSSVEFCLLKGDLAQGEETRTVYGVGMTAR